MPALIIGFSSSEPALHSRIPCQVTRIPHLEVAISRESSAYRERTLSYGDRVLACRIECFTTCCLASKFTPTDAPGTAGPPRSDFVQPEFDTE